jgi:hypothetical protein
VVIKQLRALMHRIKDGMCGTLLKNKNVMNALRKTQP